MNIVFLLYTCDIWKEFSSMRLVGATNDVNMLCSMIANQILSGNMDYDGKSKQDGFLRFREDFKAQDVNFNRLTYGFVDSPVMEELNPDNRTYQWLTTDSMEFSTHSVNE